MEVAIFIFYLLLCSLVLVRLPFFKNSFLEKKWLLSIFVLKVLAGFGYAWFYKLPKYYAGADTWRFYRLSLQEKDLLLKNPLAFIKDLFTYGYARSGNVFSGDNSYWNDLKSNIIIKLMAFMNVLTGSSYYANIILFNLLFMFGLIGLYKVFFKIYPQKKIFLIITVFLLPSALFWCSGIHKDGLLLSAVGIVIYLVHTSLTQNELLAPRVLLLLVSLLLIFFLRNYVALALLPALLCWILAYKFPAKHQLIFIAVYAAGICLFFLSGMIDSSLNLPAYIVEKQHEFLQLEGASIISLPQLLPTFKSFIKFLPWALDMALLRPHITEAKNLSYLPAAAEIVALLLLFLIFLFSRQRLGKPEPFIWFCIFFSLSILLISGYTIPFAGAIVRYRSLIMPIIVPHLVCMIKFKK